MVKPRISAYTFGRIVVDGAAYTDDVIVYPDRVAPSWWRRDGHRLVADDLREIVASRPELLVLGTGARGVMRIPEETLAFLREAGVQVHAAWTAKAVRIFNALEAESPEKRVIGAFHVTC